MLDSKRELCIAYHNKELTTDVGYKGIAVGPHVKPLTLAQQHSCRFFEIPIYIEV